MPSSPRPRAGDPTDPSGDARTISTTTSPRTVARSDDRSEAVQLAALVAAVRRDDAVGHRRQRQGRAQVEVGDASLAGLLRRAADERAEVALWVRGLEPLCPAIIAVGADHVVVHLEDRRQAAIPFEAIERCGPGPRSTTGSSPGPDDGHRGTAPHLAGSRLADRLAELAPIAVDIVDRAGRRITGRVAGCGVDVLVLDRDDERTVIPLEAIVLVAAAAAA